MHYAINLGDALNHKRQKYKCDEVKQLYTGNAATLGTKQSPAAGNNLVKRSILPRDAMLSPRIYLPVGCMIVMHLTLTDHEKSRRWKYLT